MVEQSQALWDSHARTAAEQAARRADESRALLNALVQSAPTGFAFLDGELRAQDVALVIGGADGLAPALLERAAEKLALSRLTLPHRLARVVLVEQLYRAFTILRGEPYHK